MLRIALGTLVAFTLLAVACGDENGDANDDPEPDTRITVRAENTAFSPETVTVKAGDTIELTLENHDPSEHDLQIDEIDAEVIDGGSSDEDHGGEHGDDSGLGVHAEGNESDHVTFVVDTPGTYRFYCTVQGHEEAGMVGTLVVE